MQNTEPNPTNPSKHPRSKRLLKGFFAFLALTLAVCIAAPPALAGGEQMAAANSGEVPTVTQGDLTAFRDVVLSTLYPVPGTIEADLALPTHLNATVDGQPVRVPVEGWTSVPQYSEFEGGPFVFTPIIPNGINHGQLNLPTVTVIPGGSASSGALVGSVVEVTDFAGLQAALTTEVPEDASFTILLHNDILCTAPLAVPLGKTVTILSSEEGRFALRRGFGAEALLTVPQDPGDATGLYLENVVLSGEGVEAGGPLLANNARASLARGVHLLGNVNTATPGGGIYNKGILKISDAEISGNSASTGSGIYNAGSMTLSGTVLVPAPDALAIESEQALPQVDMLGSGSNITLERTAYFSQNGATKVAKALDTFTLTENDVNAFAVLGGGFKFELSSSREALNATPIEYSVTYHYDSEQYTNPSANLSKLNVFSPVLNLVAPSASVKNEEYFIGWYTAEQKEEGTRIDTISSKNITALADGNNEIQLYAFFADQAPTRYTLSYQGYDTGRYEHSNPAFVLEDETLHLEDLYLTNTGEPEADFLGWYAQPEAGRPLTSITPEEVANLADAEGQIIFFARWREGSAASVNATAVEATAPEQPGADPAGTAPPAAGGDTKPAASPVTPALPSTTTNKPSGGKPTGSSTGGGGSQGTAQKPEEREETPAPPPVTLGPPLIVAVR